MTGTMGDRGLRNALCVVAISLLLGACGASDTSGNLNLKTYVYVANAGANTVTAWTLQDNGALLPLDNNLATATYPAGPQAGDYLFKVAADRRSDFLYGITLIGSEIHAWSIQGNGSLTAVNTYNAGAVPKGLCTSPAGDFLFVASTDDPGNTGTIRSYRIGLSGSLTSADNITVTGFNGNILNTSEVGMLVDPSGRYLYVARATIDNVSAYRIQSDGKLTLIGNFDGKDAGGQNGLLDPEGLAIATRGGVSYLYVANEAASYLSIFQIGANGSLTRKPQQVVSVPADSLAADLAGTQLFAMNESLKTVTAFAVGLDGTLAFKDLKSDPVVLVNPEGAKVDPSGRFLLVADSALDGSGSGFGDIVTLAINPAGTLGNPLSAAQGAADTPFSLEIVQK